LMARPNRTVQRLVPSIHGTAVLARLFGLAPWVALRAARAADRDAARAIALHHTRAARAAAGVRLDVGEFPEWERQEAGFVLVYNQTSMADDLGNLEVLWSHVDYNVLAAEYGYVPFFRRAASKTGMVLLQRGDRRASDAVLDRLAVAASSGAVVSMASEGRLSPDGSVGRFKRGAFLIAIRAGVPIVPMAVHGGRAILRPGSVRLRPGTLRYRFGTPIVVRGHTEDDARELADVARHAVTELYDAAAAEARAAVD